MENGDKIIVQLEKLSKDTVWTTLRIVEHLHSEVTNALQKATERAIQASPIRFEPLTDQSLVDEHARPPKRLVLDQLLRAARKTRKLILFAQLLEIDN